MTEGQVAQAAARLVGERIRQGLPAEVTDPAALARIAAALTQPGTEPGTIRPE